MTVKCPKCGSENPDGTLYCEECDWRMDQPVSMAKKQKTGKDVTIIATLALILGIAAAALYFVNVPIGGLAAGIVGMVVGGYGINLPRYIQCNKGLCMAMAGIGILLSIMGFIFSLANFA